MASSPATPLRLSSSNGESDEAESSPRSESPDKNCPICLGKVNNKAFTDACFHTFCFVCLLEWSKIRATCPLCKTSFKSIIHNVVSNDVYDQYHLKPADNGSFGTDSRGRRFRYSTTMTEEHRVEITLRHNRAAERRDRRAQQVHIQETGEERRRMIYRAGLWVRPVGSNRYSRFREISPGFFQANPATAHRLVPWLRRDLGILFRSEDHVTFLAQYIISIISSVHMQTEEFHDHLRPFLYSRTEHFIHEFVSFARSPYDMNTYEKIAQYDDPTAMHQPHNTTSQPLPLCLTLNQGHTNSHEVISLSSDDDVIEVPTLRSLLRSDSNSSASSGLANEQIEALDLSSTHNPEPPSNYNYDPDQPGPSGLFSKPNLANSEPRTGQDTTASNNSSDVEIVGIVKPYDERTPEFVTLLSSSTEEDEERTNSNQESHKEGGKRKKKKKHTRDSDTEQKQNKSSEWSVEYTHGGKTHHGHWHKKPKTCKHHKCGKHSSTSAPSTQDEPARKCSHDKHLSHHRTHKHRKKSRSRSKSGSSSQHTTISSHKNERTKDEKYRESHNSVHSCSSHSKSHSKQNSEKAHHEDTLGKYKEERTSAYCAHQCDKTLYRESWKLPSKSVIGDHTNSNSTTGNAHRVNVFSDMQSTFRLCSSDQDHHETSSRKHKFKDARDSSRERSKTKRLDDTCTQSSRLQLTMVLSRKSQGQHLGSRGTDVISVRTSDCHRRKHKRHKRHKNVNDKERSDDHSYADNVRKCVSYDESIDTVESSQSTEEEMD